MLAIAENWLGTNLDYNRILKRAEKALVELAHSLDPTDHQGGLSSGINIQPGSKLLVSKGKLSDKMVNSGVMENHS